jgi:hypothetical protein
VETTIGQLVTTLVGRGDDQVLEMVKPLLATGASGPVQRALTNGYLLCSRRTPIVVTIEGEHKTTSIGTRFLSSDPEILDRYILEPRQRRAESFVKNTKELTALVEQRQPDMAPRIGSFMEQLSITWEKALTPGSAA